MPTPSPVLLLWKTAESLFLNFHIDRGISCLRASLLHPNLSPTDKFHVNLRIGHVLLSFGPTSESIEYLESAMSIARLLDLNSLYTVTKLLGIAYFALDSSSNQSKSFFFLRNSLTFFSADFSLYASLVTTLLNIVSFSESKQDSSQVDHTWIYEQIGSIITYFQSKNDCSLALSDQILFHFAVSQYSLSRSRIKVALDHLSFVKTLFQQYSESIIPKDFSFYYYILFQNCQLLITELKDSDDVANSQNQSFSIVQSNFDGFNSFFENYLFSFYSGFSEIFEIFKHRQSTQSRQFQNQSNLIDSKIPQTIHQFGGLFTLVSKNFFLLNSLSFQNFALKFENSIDQVISFLKISIGLGLFENNVFTNFILISLINWFIPVIHSINSYESSKLCTIIHDCLSKLSHHSIIFDCFTLLIQVITQNQVSDYPSNLIDHVMAVKNDNTDFISDNYWNCVSCFIVFLIAQKSKLIEDYDPCNDLKILANILNISEGSQSYIYNTVENFLYRNIRWSNSTLPNDNQLKILTKILPLTSP
ncbi:hypothetical protein RCL1_008425 [Eukaryota sp. TZLM3-RCL]